MSECCTAIPNHVDCCVSHRVADAAIETLRVEHDTSAVSMETIDAANDYLTAYFEAWSGNIAKAAK
jgi:hypothetical protein